MVLLKKNMGIPSGLWLSLAWTKHVHHEGSAGVTPVFKTLPDCRQLEEVCSSTHRKYDQYPRGGQPVSKRVSTRKMPSSLPERTLIWCEIKAAVPVMLRNGVSSVGVLVWSQGKSLVEVVEVLFLLRIILKNAGGSSFYPFTSRCRPA